MGITAKISKALGVDIGNHQVHVRKLGNDIEYSFEVVFCASLKVNPTMSSVGLIRFKDENNTIAYTNIIRLLKRDREEAFQALEQAISKTREQLNKQFTSQIEDSFTIYIK